MSRKPLPPLQRDRETLEYFDKTFQLDTAGCSSQQLGCVGRLPGFGSAAWALPPFPKRTGMISWEPLFQQRGPSDYLQRGREETRSNSTTVRRSEHRQHRALVALATTSFQTALVVTSQCPTLCKQSTRVQSTERALCQQKAPDWSKLTD